MRITRCVSRKVSRKAIGTHDHGSTQGREELTTPVLRIRVEPLLLPRLRVVSSFFFFLSSRFPGCVSAY